MHRRSWILLCLLLISTETAAAAAFAAEAVERLSAFVRAEGAIAIAASASGRVIVGDARGAWSARGSGPARRLVSGVAVRDAVFTADGALWLATDDGVHREDPETGRILSDGPGPGAARRVHDLVPAGPGVVAATEAGLFHVKAESARPLGSTVPRGEATALAWAGVDGGAGGVGEGVRWLAAIVDGRVHRVRLDAELRVEAVDRLVLPPGAGIPLDVAASEPGVWILTEHALVRADGRDVERTPVAFPAGAEPVRIVTANGRVWLATGRGLYVRDATSWRAVGSTGVPIAALAAVGATVWAAGPRGVWRVAAEVASPSAAVRAEARPAVLAVGPPMAGPPILQVHAAVVLAHDLDSARGHRWRARVARRGRWPELELRLGYGGHRDQSADYDEAFTPGALRRLYDWDRDRGRDFDVQAVVRWDWGDAVYHPEEVDVAREVREWIELRDEILDEVDQLYFERLRVLAERDALGPGDLARVRLGIRAAELSAGLDAWTVGWWSRALASAAGSSFSPRSGPTENQP